jgi:hypothetical protein
LTELIVRARRAGPTAVQAAQEAAEAEWRDRQRARLKGLLSVVKTAHQAEVAAQNAADREELHTITDGRRAAEAHAWRAAARRLRGTRARERVRVACHLRDIPWSVGYPMER